MFPLGYITVESESVAALRLVLLMCGAIVERPVEEGCLLIYSMTRRFIFLPLTVTEICYCFSACLLCLRVLVLVSVACHSGKA